MKSPFQGFSKLEGLLLLIVPFVQFSLKYLIMLHSVTTLYSMAQKNLYFSPLRTDCRHSPGSPQDFRLIANEVAYLRCTRSDLL